MHGVDEMKSKINYGGGQIIAQVFIFSNNGNFQKVNKVKGQGDTTLPSCPCKSRSAFYCHWVVWVSFLEFPALLFFPSGILQTLGFLKTFPLHLVMPVLCNTVHLKDKCG